MSLQERKIITRIYKSFFITHISFVNEKKKKKKRVECSFYFQIELYFKTTECFSLLFLSYITFLEFKYFN